MPRRRPAACACATWGLKRVWQSARPCEPPRGGVPKRGEERHGSGTSNSPHGGREGAGNRPESGLRTATASTSVEQCAL